MITRLSILAAAAMLVAGCATQTTGGAGQPESTGRHLVYRDASGNAIRQFIYPDDSFCRRVEALAGRTARCQAEPVPGMTARAMLRYNPPGVLVEGQYSDMNRCRTDNSVMSAGVQLVNPCAPQ